MIRHTIATVLAVGSMVAVSACGGSEGTSSTDAAVTTAATTTTLAVTDYGGATYVTGYIDQFVIDEGTVTTNSDGVLQTRDGTIQYRLVSDDPRVAGTVTGTWNTNRWGAGIDAGVMIEWGEATLTNDAGSWEAQYQGAFASPIGDVLTRWWRGSGAYEGLTFYMWITGSQVGAASFQWGGVIVPGDPPPGV